MKTSTISSSQSIRASDTAYSVDTVDTFPFDILQYVRPCRRANGRPSSFSQKYADIICTFDIETTALDDIKQSVMYHWQACIDGLVCVGRTWEEYQTFLDQCDKYLPKGLTLIQWVHNLSYEFQFLRAVHDFQPDEVFCLTGRKIARCSIGKRFEYRCSFCLTNMSLREFLDKMKVEHKKTEMDYSLKRFSWSPMSASDMEYCIMDVLGLYEALKTSFSADGLPLTEVPMTSTGYVRKRFKAEMRKGGFMPLVHECAPDYEVYKMIRRAFRGGNTHANRYYTGVIMDNVSSWDRSSSYPDCLVNYPYPVKPFIKQRTTRIEDLLPGFPYLLEIEFTDLELRDPFIGCPYLPTHKCYNYEDDDGNLFPLTGAINDNGRVISAVGRSFIHFCTNIDLDIIKEQYKWSSARIIKCYRSEYGMLPKALIDTTMSYYRDKTQLKGVEDQEVLYVKSKALL